MTSRDPAPPVGLPTSRCPDCGDPLDGPALMTRCQARHTQPKGR